MPRRSCDGPGLLETFRAAVRNLEAHVDEINGLNVYPVPDGDTGSNMYATVKAALDEADAVTEVTVERIAAAISFGALMGARGNSGVITSQIFRGMSEGLGGKQRFNGLDLAHALTEGARTAYGAVARPVEGTILTVIRESAEAAVVAAEASNDIESVLAATLDAAEKSVARTPSLLAILREAGVVDSGGQGLYRLFQGALLHLVGEAPARVAARGIAPAAPRPSTLVAHADEGFGYETMFLLQARPGHALDVDAIRDHLESIGESVLVAGDSRALKVHVHNERPDEVIGFGLTSGTLSRISVENLDNQARDVREARASEFTGADAAAARSRTERSTTEPAPPAVIAVETSSNGSSPETPLRPGPAIVAVVAGDGLSRVYEDFGVDQILHGGQTNNPSTGDLLRVARLARAREVVLLPNNPNVRLAAEQAAKVCKDKRIVVVPTRNAAEGIAALLALDPTLDAAANAEPMTAASRAIQTVQVTEAVRNATIGGRKVKQGQTIALDPDDGLVAVNGNRDKAVLAAIAAFEPGFELVTVYYGADATLAEAEAIARRIGQTAQAEVEVVHGGQPHYRYLISAE
ncbi:MAG TPA: DAK2 domain-containing protein [Candidatus Limnocylindrales bacterium]|nr:DAK2 domain-containing protein [Candidatus Limnocylindrales bacterium]